VRQGAAEGAPVPESTFLAAASRVASWWWRPFCRRAGHSGRHDRSPPYSALRAFASPTMPSRCWRSRPPMEPRSCTLVRYRPSDESCFQPRSSP
jgi:hypothetical protein